MPGADAGHNYECLYPLYPRRVSMTGYDLAVIGGGPGGLAAAMYGGLRGLSTVVFEAEAFGGQLINLYPTKPVTNYPALPELVSRDIARRLAEQAAKFGAALHEWEPVEHVGHSDGEFTISAGGRDAAAKTVVLALGLGRFTPRRLGLTDEHRYEGRGLTYRLPPIEEIESRHAVVVGGGDSALDTALSLRTKVEDVTIVHRREAFSAYAFSQGKLREADVKLVTNGEVVELVGDDALTGVVVALAGDSMVEMPADLLLVSIGQVPELRGVEGWELAIKGTRLAVNAAMETETPGAFAAGDFASYTGKVKMIATAVAEGSTAAASAERYLLNSN
jgi:thioredoxin reductase (NADPH)